METFILISAILFWFCLGISLIVLIFASKARRRNEDIDCIFEQKFAENASEAPQSDDLTHVTDMLVSTSRLLDTYNEAAQMEFNDSVITSHDLNQIDSLL